MGGSLVFLLVEGLPHLLSDHQVVLYATFIMLAACVGALSHLVAAARETGRSRVIWSLTALGLGLFALAELSMGMDTVLTGEAVPHPSLARGLALAALAPTVAGAIALAIPLGPRGRSAGIRTALDGLIVISALLGTALAMTAAERAAEPDSQALVVLFLSVPATAALGMAFVLLANGPLSRITALTAIAGGAAVLSAALLAETLMDTTSQAWPRPWTADGYLLSAGLLGIAPWLPRPQAPGRGEPLSTVPSHLLPYLPVGILTAIVLTRSSSGQPPEPGVLWCCAVMIGAVLARQFLTVHRNVSLARDLAEQRARLAREAAHDTLTGLPNRALLNSQLDALEAVSSDDATPALLMIDLDGFKAVNDTLGHTAGDLLLTRVAHRLRRRVAASQGQAIPARLGGDEFAILVQDGGLDAARELAEDILRDLAEPLVLGGRPVAVRASIGIAARTEGITAERLLQHADLALYEAKRRDKGRFRLFDRAMAATIEARRGLRTDLARALAEQQFTLVYQPIVDLNTGHASSSEALLRWHHPHQGRLEPKAFLPSAVDAGLVSEIDRWVLSEACEQLARWRAQVPDHGISVNVSTAYLSSGRLVEDIRDVLRATRLPPTALTVEVTEDSLIADLEEAARVLREIRAVGVGVALDDFGVGYSSLTYLRELPVDTVKIDRSFVRDFDRDPRAAILVGNVLDLVHGLGLDCVAEGVEAPGQVSLLRTFRCGRAQGFIFARPKPADEFAVRRQFGDVLSCAPR